MAEKVRKKIRFWTNIVVLALCLFLVSCQKADYLPPIEGAYLCRGELCGEPFAATVTVDTLRVVYTSGLIATENGLVLHGMEIENSNLYGFLVPVRLLAEPFTVTSVKADKEKTVILGENGHGSREVTVMGTEIVYVKGAYDGIYAEFEVEFSP